MTERTQKLIVVTGGSTGMGASAVRELARQGFHVLAGVRRDPGRRRHPIGRHRAGHPRHHRARAGGGARYPIGRDAALITRLARMLSDRTLDRISAANLRRHYPKGATA